MASRKTPKYIDVDGYVCPQSFIPENIRSAMNYKPRPDDVIVATFAKCGTTWTVQIAMLILKKGQLPSSPMEYFSWCPFLELNGAESMTKIPRPVCAKTHLPFDRICYSSEAKYIYVARHPRDCVVSFYHHTRFFPLYCFTDGTFDDFFELFIRGETDFNDYFDNLLSWYEHRNCPNVFFTTFEAMKADHRGTVLKFAEFLGEEYSSELKANNYELLDKIVHYSSFEYMKKDTNDYFKDLFSDPTKMDPAAAHDEVSKKIISCTLQAVKDGHSSLGNFVRKGTVGEGKTVLTAEQEKRLNARILEKTRHSDVMSLWQNLQ